MELSHLIPRHATYRPDHPAVIFGDRRLTYRDLNREANRLANALLDLGLEKGDKVATVLPNCLELLCFYWAVARTGIVAVPMSPLLGAQGLANLMADADTRGVLCHASTADVVNEALAENTEIGTERRIVVGGAVPGFRSYEDLTEGVSADLPPDAGLAPEDLFNIVYSSGTTGAPKGIMHSHNVRAMYGALFASALRILPESVILHAGAIIFNGAFITLMPCFFQGATYVLQPAFDAGKFINAIEKHQATHVVLVPSQIIQLLNHPRFTERAAGSLKMILSLGAPLHLEHKQRLEKVLPSRFHELYGVTEGFVTILDHLDFGRKPESVGCPTPGFRVRITDDAGNERPTGEVGEICGTGPIAMTGYYKRPDLTAETVQDGWIKSGDLGYLDEDGFLYLVDRKKDLIISGGVNVYPRDIEEVIVRHSAVAEVAVLGVADKKWGETPVAAVVPVPGKAPEAETLKAWINDNVEARFQKVSQVLIVDDFPRNAAGKILKRELADLFS